MYHKIHFFLLLLEEGDNSHKLFPLGGENSRAESSSLSNPAPVIHERDRLFLSPVAIAFNYLRDDDIRQESQVK
ncbi:hypothetical protein [Laspinema olomoucense]|uniref:hypothetical protein n=1 Tax=Laspinema olomoucense TaxID=3231600 RepID=UPI0021BB0AD6|nr:hypothetical protein [Laspinema sp. D3c]MCT7993450.1 hypothetical protein [Laspinema sp. D3c]